MWSQWPWVSSTSRTLSCLARSRRRSCSLAASSRTASPVCLHRSTYTLLSIGPTTTLWISACSSCQCNVFAMSRRLGRDLFGVTRRLCHPSFVERDDSVGARQHGRAVRDDQQRRRRPARGRAAGEAVPQRVFGLDVEGRREVVDDQQLG